MKFTRTSWLPIMQWPRRRPNLKADLLNETVLLSGRRRSTALPSPRCLRKAHASCAAVDRA